MNLGDVFDDGQAESGAAHFAGTGAVDAVEALEDSRQILLGDAQSVVGDFNDHMTDLDFRQHADTAIFARVLDGVVDEIGNRALEIVGVADDRWQLVGSGDGELLAFAGGGGGEQVGRLANDGRQVDALQPWKARLAFQTRKLQQIVDEIAQLDRMLLYGVQKLRADDRVFDRPIPERLDEAPDDS